MAKDNGLEVEGMGVFCSFLLLLVGILLLQWSDWNGFVLKGLWKEVSVWKFSYTPKYKQCRGLRETRGHHSDLAQLTPGQAYSIQGYTYWPPSQALVLPRKGLNTLIKVRSAAEFCKKTQNLLTHMERLLQSTEKTLASFPQPLGQTFQVPAGSHKLR